MAPDHLIDEIYRVGRIRPRASSDGKGHGFVIADRAIDLRGHVDAILAASKRRKA